MQPGHSGGALVDGRNNVIGFVSAKLDASVALAASGALPEVAADVSPLILPAAKSQSRFTSAATAEGGGADAGVLNKESRKQGTVFTDFMCSI